ncbi:unnamed protein product, partial [Mesorhabditis spiculigera]
MERSKSYNLRSRDPVSELNRSGQVPRPLRLSELQLDDAASITSIQATKRRSLQIDDGDEEAETVIVRKRHRSAPEVGGTAILGPVPAYQAAAVTGRGKYVSLCAWSKEEKSAATLLVEDHPDISVNELFEWSRRRGHLIKRSSIRAFIVRPGSGRPLSLMELHKEDLEAAVKMNPRISSRQLAAVLGIPRTSARLMCQQLGYRRYKMRPVQMLSAKNKEDRLRCARNFLDGLESGDLDLKRILFSDEKFIRIDPPKGDQFVLSKATTKREVEEELLDMPHGKPTGPGFTFWGGVGGNGKKLPLLVLEQGQRIGGLEYRYFLEHHIIPYAEQLFGHNFIYQHDWAPGHNDTKTHQMLIQKGIRYLDRSEYPPNSPDLNPLDYSIWSMHERRVRDLTAGLEPNMPLKERKEAFAKALRRAWAKLPEEQVEAAVAQLPERLSLVIKNEGGNIEAQYGARVRYRKQ